jgi:hypothetical protein
MSVRGDGDGEFFSHGDRDVELSPDGEFLADIPSCALSGLTRPILLRVVHATTERP